MIEHFKHFTGIGMVTGGFMPGKTIPQKSRGVSGN
jgi:hypothetical protein